MVSSVDPPVDLALFHQPCDRLLLKFPEPLPDLARALREDDVGVCVEHAVVVGQQVREVEAEGGARGERRRGRGLEKKSFIFGIDKRYARY